MAGITEEMIDRAGEIEEEAGDQYAIVLTGADPGDSVMIYSEGSLYPTSFQSNDAYEEPLMEGMVGLVVLEAFFDNDKQQWDYYEEWIEA